MWSRCVDAAGARQGAKVRLGAAVPPLLQCLAHPASLSCAPPHEALPSQHLNTHTHACTVDLAGAPQVWAHWLEHPIRVQPVGPQRVRAVPAKSPHGDGRQEGLAAHMGDGACARHMSPWHGSAARPPLLRRVAVCSDCAWLGCWQVNVVLSRALLLGSNNLSLCFHM